MKRSTKNQDFWTDQYKTQANQPIMWFMTAEELRSSYLVLADHANKMFKTHSSAKTVRRITYV